MKAALALALCAAALAAGLREDAVEGSRLLLQLRLLELKGPLEESLARALKRGVKVKILLSQPGGAEARLKAAGALLKFATLKEGEGELVVADAAKAVLDGAAATATGRAAALSVEFERRWKGASASAARQWEKEFRALPDPRSPEDSAPRVQTRRRK